MNLFFPLRVASVSPETRDAVLVSFELEEEHRKVFRFSAGQYLTVRAQPGGLECRRCYSICSAPHEGELRIAIKRVEDGLFSSWAHRELRPGDVVECMPPAGSFGVPVELAAERHHVGFAVGSGITPVVSIAKSMLKGEPRSRFTLVYGNRSSSSVMFREEIADLKDRYLERFDLVSILSREPQDVELLHGRIDRAKCDSLLECWLHPEDIDVAYVCGPRSMMEDVTSSLEAAGVPPACIRREMFGAGHESRSVYSSEAAGGGETCRVSVIQDGHQRKFSMAMKVKTLLDGALEQGMELPYSCKGGVCSSCRCKMTEGEVDMDVNFALEDYEVARGFILPCQSYPRTRSIVLDFDQES